MSSGKKFLFSVLAVLSFFLFGFICLEIYQRLTGATQPNPLASIVQKRADCFLDPNTTAKSNSLERGITYTVHSNNYGYRGDDFSAIKPKGVTRIFVVGDSFTFGTGEQDNETIPFMLQEKLRAENFKVEVINAGVGHSSPVSHYVNIRDIHLRYHPDLVLLLFDLTDLWDDWHWERSAIFDKNGEIIRFDPDYINGRRDWWLSCVSRSAACGFIHNKLVRTFRKIKAIGFKRYIKAVLSGQKVKALIASSQDIKSDELVMEYDGLLFMRGHKREGLIRKHWARTTRYMLKIKELLDKNNIAYVIVMYPHGIYVGPDQWSKGRQAWGFETNTVYTDYLPFEMMTEFTKDNKLPFINTLSDFLKAPAKKYFFNYDGHFTVDGNRVVVDAIISNPDFIKELNRIVAKNK